MRGGAGSSAAAAATPTEPPPSRRLRVCLTGFNDWVNLTPESGGTWRSRENPSSRLLLGAAGDSPSFLRGGALATILRRSCNDVDWSFQTLPTLWKTSCCIDYFFFDLVIHLGLGVYDNTNTILLERGAYNLRGDFPDAEGHPPPARKLCAHVPLGHTLEAPPRVARGIEAAAALTALPGGFHVAVENAREDNAYICNETHWRALEAVAAAEAAGAQAALRAAYFIHLPYPRVEDEYGPMAEAVAEVVKALVLDLRAVIAD